MRKEEKLHKKSAPVKKVQVPLTKCWLFVPKCWLFVTKCFPFRSNSKCWLFFSKFQPLFLITLTLCLRILTKYGPKKLLNTSRNHEEKLYLQFLCKSVFPPQHFHLNILSLGWWIIRIKSAAQISFHQTVNTVYVNVTVLFKVDTITF